MLVQPRDSVDLKDAPLTRLSRNLWYDLNSRARPGPAILDHARNRLIKYISTILLTVYLVARSIGYQWFVFGLSLP
jgi:hypothetical protein